MKLLSVIIISASISFTCFSLEGPIKLVVTPTNSVLRPAQPALFVLELSNISSEPVKGIFVPLQYGFAGLLVEITDPLGNKYLFAHDEVADDIAYDEVGLKSGEVVKSSLIIHYDMIKKCHVFTQPGEYSLSFVLRWKWQESRESVTKTTVKVKVLDWDKDIPNSIIVAKDLWMDQGIAHTFQTNAELSDFSLERLRELVKKYSETVYGKLALDLLKRQKSPKFTDAHLNPMRKIQKSPEK